MLVNNYPYYADNPYLMLSKVRTYNGDIEYKDNCIVIGVNYYSRGKQVMLVNDEWVIVNQSKTKVYDYELKLEQVLTENMTKGVVEIDSKGKPKMGYFTKNPLKNCLVNTEQGTHVCMDYRILDEEFYFESVSDGMFYQKALLSPQQRAKLSKKAVGNVQTNQYNIEDNPSLFKDTIKNYNNYVLDVEDDIASGAQYLEDATFGIELETCNGILATHLCAQHGVVVCKDGSTKDENNNYPPEYVTIPLTGEKGLQTAKNLCLRLAERSDIDLKCSYHLHMGIKKPTRKFMVAMYRLCYKIQNDVFKMFPYYKTDPEGVKSKNYCKKLLNNIVSGYSKGDVDEYIESAFTDLFVYLSGGVEPKESRLNKNGIRSKENPWGEHKWDMTTRYHWVNFVNPVFGKHDTIEFRIHTPTLNPDKVINWIFICNAIMKYAEVNFEKCIAINRISLKEVLGFYSDMYSEKKAAKLTENLIKYYKDRVEYFKKDYDKNDYVSSLELKEDSKFTFNILNFK